MTILSLLYYFSRLLLPSLNFHLMKIFLPQIIIFFIIIVFFHTLSPLSSLHLWNNNDFVVNSASALNTWFTAGCRRNFPGHLGYIAVTSSGQFLFQKRAARPEQFSYRQDWLGSLSRPKKVARFSCFLLTLVIIIMPLNGGERSFWRNWGWLVWLSTLYIDDYLFKWVSTLSLSNDKCACIQRTLYNFVVIENFFQFPLGHFILHSILVTRYSAFS